MDKIIPTVGIVLLHGKYGSFKTSLSVHIANCISLGLPLFGMETTKTKVLYVEGDTPHLGLWPRLHKMGLESSHNLHFAFIYPGFNAVQPKQGDRNPKICAALSQRHRAHQYGLVVIDSLRTSHPLPDKDSEVPSIVYGALANMFPNACILVVHHDRKSRPPDYRSNGTSRIATDTTEELDAESFSGTQAWIDRATTALRLKKGYGPEKDWITMVQSKSQVGEQVEPIPLHVTEGCLFNTTPNITNAQLVEAILGGGIPKKALDQHLANHFQIPLKLARMRRIKYESEVGPLL